MQAPTKQHLTNLSIWSRLGYMLFYLIGYAVAETLWMLTALVQVVIALFTGSIDPALHRFGGQLARYVFQIVQFETFNSEYHPYPFGEWPNDNPDGDPDGDDSDSPWLSAAAATATQAADTTNAADTEPAADASTDNTSTDNK